MQRKEVERYIFISCVSKSLVNLTSVHKMTELAYSDLPESQLLKLPIIDIQAAVSRDEDLPLELAAKMLYSIRQACISSAYLAYSARLQRWFF